MFNCCRAGETERILIDDYKNYEYACGTDFTRKTKRQTDRGHEYVRFIRRKLNRTSLCIIKHANIKKYSNLLRFRKDTNVSQNSFIFEISDTTKNCYFIYTFVN